MYEKGSPETGSFLLKPQDLRCKALFEFEALGLYLRKTPIQIHKATYKQ